MTAPSTNNIILGFDFSINKPACTLYRNGTYTFIIWPHKLPSAHMIRYMTSGVVIVDRGDDTYHGKENSQTPFFHIRRASGLAEIISRTIKNILSEEGLDTNPIYLSSEGLSFNSSGLAALDLASYKGIFLKYMWDVFGDRLRGVFTYPPATIKKVAGCTSKKDIIGKEGVIRSFLRESSELRDNIFFQDMLKGRFLNKNNNHIICCDDIVDSYFAAKTVMAKERL